GRSRVATVRTKVVLPAPLGPSTARIWPGSAPRSSPSRAAVLPNRWRRRVASIVGGMLFLTSWLLGWLLGGDLHVGGAAVDLDLVAALRSARLAALQPPPAAGRAELLVVEGQVAQ